MSGENKTPKGFTPSELASLDDGSGDIYRAVASAHDHAVDENGDLLHACRACLMEAGLEDLWWSLP